MLNNSNSVYSHTTITLRYNRKSTIAQKCIRSINVHNSYGFIIHYGHEKNIMFKCSSIDIDLFVFFQNNYSEYFHKRNVSDGCMETYCLHYIAVGN